MNEQYDRIGKRIQLQGEIIHAIVLDGLEEAFSKYPEEVDFILDFMNGKAYQQLKNINKKDKELENKYC